MKVRGRGGWSVGVAPTTLRPWPPPCQEMEMDVYFLDQQRQPPPPLPEVAHLPMGSGSFLFSRSWLTYLALARLPAPLHALDARRDTTAGSTMVSTTTT